MCIVTFKNIYLNDVQLCYNNYNAKKKKKKNLKPLFFSDPLC